MWEGNTVGWLISSGWNQRANRLIMFSILIHFFLAIFCKKKYIYNIEKKSVDVSYTLLRGSAIAYHLLRSKAGHEGKKEKVNSSARNDRLGVEIPFVVHHALLYSSFSYLACLLGPHCWKSCMISSAFHFSKESCYFGFPPFERKIIQFWKRKEWFFVHENEVCCSTDNIKFQ